MVIVAVLLLDGPEIVAVDADVVACADCCKVAHSHHHQQKQPLVAATEEAEEDKEQR